MDSIYILALSFLSRSTIPSPLDMFLLVITLAVVANAAKLQPGQQSPRGAAEAGGGQFLSTPDQRTRQAAGPRTGPYAGPPAPIVNILAYSNQPDLGDGSYTYSFQGDNGIQAQETGSVAGPESGTSAQGGYTYVSPDGQQISISYTAGEEGFVPQGAHLPVAPPIPEEILRALAKNAQDEAAGIFDDGLYRV